MGAWTSASVPNRNVSLAPTGDSVLVALSLVTQYAIMVPPPPSTGSNDRLLAPATPPVNFVPTLRTSSNGGVAPAVREAACTVHQMFPGSANVATTVTPEGVVWLAVTDTDDTSCRLAITSLALVLPALGRCTAVASTDNVEVNRHQQLAATSSAARTSPRREHKRTLAMATLRRKYVGRGTAYREHNPRTGSSTPHAQRSLPAQRTTGPVRIDRIGYRYPRMVYGGLVGIFSAMVRFERRMCFSCYLRLAPSTSCCGRSTVAYRVYQ